VLTKLADFREVNEDGTNEWELTNFDVENDDSANFGSGK
jgi:hypothetical protein